MSIAAPEPKANLGQPIPRYDAVAKVTGKAQYGADVALVDPVYAFLVTSSIARGRIDGFDLSASKQVRGVVDIVTHENAEKLKEAKLFSNGGYTSSTIQPLKSADIAQEGQIVAVVLAETFEGARQAAYAVKVNYTAAIPTTTFDSPGTTSAPTKGQLSQFKEDPKVGDFAKAFDAAEVKITAEYETPPQHHNPMELFATSCAWNGDNLTIYEPTQYVHGLKNGVAEQLDIDADKVMVINSYVGGAFGSKGSMTPRTAIIASIARRLGRPVKLVATRDQGFTIATFRAETRHQIKLGATRDGKLTSLRHEGWEISSRPDPYDVGGTKTTTRIYACPNVDSLVSIVRADRNTPGFMRAPPEVPYMFALESAMDELAFELKIDPIELRRVNDTMKEPIKGNPFTSRSLMACFDEGAKAFGWSQCKADPKSMADRDWLVGYGCATSCYPTQMAPAAARVRLQRDGRVRVQIAGHEIGNGAYTVIGQAAAEKLGVAVDKVSVFIGDSDLPPAPVAGGSNSTASTCSTVIMVGGPEMSDKFAYAFGAEFVEVRINRWTHEIRVLRLLRAFAAGHIMNPRTARSQLMGGLIWGMSSALHEATELDERYARYVNDNLADHLLPVNADLASVEVIMLPEQDDHINPAGVKGIGELGNVGTNAAVCNAIFHATGQRLRKLPIRLEQLNI